MQCYIGFSIAFTIVTEHFWRIWLLGSLQETILLLCAHAWGHVCHKQSHHTHTCHVMRSWLMIALVLVCFSRSLIYQDIQILHCRLNSLILNVVLDWLLSEISDHTPHHLCWYYTRAYNITSHAYRKEDYIVCSIVCWLRKGALNKYKELDCSLFVHFWSCHPYFFLQFFLHLCNYTITLVLVWVLSELCSELRTKLRACTI